MRPDIRTKLYKTSQIRPSNPIHLASSLMEGGDEASEEENSVTF